MIARHYLPLRMVLLLSFFFLLGVLCLSSMDAAADDTATPGVAENGANTAAAGVPLTPPPAARDEEKEISPQKSGASADANTPAAAGAGVTRSGADTAGKTNTAANSGASGTAGTKNGAAATGSGNAGADDNNTEGEENLADDPLAQIWSARTSDLSSFVEEAGALQRNAETLAKPLASNLQDIRARFTRLSGLFQISREHPTEQLTLVQQMHSLQNELDATIRPLDDIAATINQRLQEIGKLQKEFTGLTKESSADGISLRQDGMDDMHNYTQILADAQKKLSRADLRVNKILTPAQHTEERIKQSIAEIEGSLIATWEKYYLTPSDNTFSALASTPALLAGWVSSLNSRMGFAYPQSATEWSNAAKSFAGSAFIMIVLGLLGLHGSRVLPARWRRACERVIKRAWIWVGIGLSVLQASSNQRGGIYFAFVLLGGLILIAGIAALSWRLRIAVLPTLQWKPSPLMRLYPPAALGVLMLFSDLPTRILGIVWGLVMLIFVLMIFSMNRKHKSEDILPFLERLSYGCAFWFGLASLLVAVAGYARLAILLFMLLFALVNTVIFSNALMALFTILADRLFSKESKPVRNAIAQAATTPIAWVLSLVCTLPWIWAVPGANYLLRHAMSTSYTVGKASFDFSKLLFILLLFFLFRSFITLARTSLNHLPDRMPYVERGVIPPLNTMVTYGFWAVFALLSLGLLGVDFTSLAVVAGGLSVGIGFGMQTIFNNLISGLLLIFGRNILVGDWVEIAGAAGTVKAISIRSTTIETVDNALIYVPNSAMMAGQLTNWTRNTRMVRRSIVVGVAYGTDTAQVAKLLLQVAAEQEHVVKHPSSTVFFSNFGNNSLDFTLNVYIDDFSNAAATLSALRFKIEKSFGENGIDIPFPQLTLHMVQEGK